MWPKVSNNFIQHIIRTNDTHVLAPDNLDMLTPEESSTLCHKIRP